MSLQSFRLRAGRPASRPAVNVTGLPLQDSIKHAAGTTRAPAFSPDGRVLLSSKITGPGSENPSRLWAAPTTGPGNRAPSWLVRLATICAGRRLNESAKIESALDEFDRFDDLRREIAGLPDTAPYAAWAKWFLSTEEARSIAPGFTITPVEAKKLEDERVARAALPPPAAPVPAPKP